VRPEVLRSAPLSRGRPYRLGREDFLQGAASLEDACFDLAIVDPPYGASTGAAWKIAADHALEGMGGKWDLASHAWDRIEGLESLRFTLAWLHEVRRLVKPTGSIWIHGTYHNAGIANVACQMLGLEIINEVVWYKRNAFPNLSARRMTASHETILWVHTGGPKDRRYRFNYEDVKAADYESDHLKKPGKQLRTVWDIPNNKAPDELAHGKHPTQKPLRVVERLLAVSGLEGGELLVPFAGSGSEMVGGLRHGMRPTGFEVEAEYRDLATRRLEAELTAS
jgi:site-specific DNA-methyltransferase (adenine-specific)